MAQIFKRTIVKQKISEVKVKDFDKKLAIIQLWYKAYQDGSLQKKTEGQCEQSFNDDIFKKVLGYTEYPSQPHTIVPQLSPERGGQRADAGLGYFDTNRQRIFAVVEIKDVNKPLDRSQQREGNLTPIQQAFKYKPLFKDCRFVIATNFYEIRLFQDNQLDYEQFTLKSLCDPANDYFELKKFILLLSAENFVSGRGKSKTEELLAEIRIEQEKISKNFYNQYSDLRLELMRDIWKQNHFRKNTKDIHIVTDKAQKLLDRIVFVSFCEDTGLLPDNTLHKVFKHSESSFSSVWDTLKGFFSAVDSGSDKLGIPEGYNGGLFHEDSELDNLKISDEALKSLGKIGNYDFENELTVNILGHVFEQSISDLEEIKQKVDPDEASKKSKRKKDGIFYTPEYIVDYIVQNSLGKYLRENEERIFERYELSKARTEKTYREREQSALQEYQDFLRTVKVVDPACGSGAFLVKVFDYLLEENRRVGELIGGLFSQDQVYKDILKNNIYGVDLNEESVRITQLSLWLKTAQKGKKLTYLDENIRVGNSLIADPKVAGSKAFNWQVEFKEVFEKGGFDVVVGNPPYVNSKQIDKKDRDFIWNENENILMMDIDLYEIFLYKSTSQLLKNDGLLGFIIPNSYTTNKSFEKLREYLLLNTKIINIVDFPYRFFPFNEVNTETSIIIIKKQKIDTPQEVAVNTAKKDPLFSTNLANQNKRTIYIPSLPATNCFFLNLESELTNKLSQVDSINFDDYFSLTNPSSLDRKKRCPKTTNSHYSKCIFTQEEIERDSELKSISAKAIEGENILKYLIHGPRKFTNLISYEGNEINQKTLQIMRNVKLVGQRITGQAKNRIVFTFDSEGYITMPSVNIIYCHSQKIDHEKALKTLLCIINSSTYNFLYKKVFGETNTNITSDVFKIIPLPKSLFEKSDQLSSLCDEVLRLNKDLYSKNKSVLSIIKSNTSLEKLPQKFDKWWELEKLEVIDSLSIKSITMQSEILDFLSEKKEFFENQSALLEMKIAEIDEITKKAYKFDE